MLITVLQETFNVENFHGSVRSDHFARKLSRNAKTYHRSVWHTHFFVEKTFTDGSKTVKSVNVFYLESFLLYGTSCILLA